MVARVLLLISVCFGSVKGTAQYYGLDTTWHHDGFALGESVLGESIGRGLAIRSNGVLATGLYANGSGNGVFVVGYDEGGTVVDGFGLNGYVYLADHGTPLLAARSDGSFVVATSAMSGSSKAVVVSSFLSNGDSDAAFGTNGTTIIDVTDEDDTPIDLVMDDDGAAVLVGSQDGTSRCLRLGLDGYPDAGFGTNGLTAPTTAIMPSAIDIGPNGRLVVAGGGWTNPIWLRCFDTNGNLDASFGVNGHLDELGNFSLGGSVGDMIVLSNGDILVTGHLWGSGTVSEDMYLLRLQSDGARQPSFASNGLLIRQLANHQRAGSIALQSSGQIVVAGYYYPNAAQGGSGWSVFRCSPAGVIDPQFANGLGLENGVQPPLALPHTIGDYASMSIDGADRILLVGDADAMGDGTLAVARLLSALGTTGVEGGEALTSFSVYPNPCKDVLFVDLERDVANNGSIDCFDAQGRSVDRWEWNGSMADRPLALEISSWSPGLYTVVQRVGGTHRVARFIKR